MRILPIVCAVLTLPLFADDESSFASPPPVEWQRYDPRTLVGLSPAVFDFSSGQCRIQAGTGACAGPIAADVGVPGPFPVSSAHFRS